MPPDILDLARELRAKGEAFAMATVVRTVAATAAKAGAKALIAPGGTISGGWIGGGCARAAVLKAAAAALADGQPRLLSLQPAYVLAAQGLQPDNKREGMEFATNSCPSQGTMDIFVEPFLPRPHLLIFGASPVAVALAELASRMGFSTSIAAPGAARETFPAADRLIDGFGVPPQMPPANFAVIATQGSGDLAALTAALALGAPYTAFVGSRKKAAALKARLAQQGAAAAPLAALHAPAGIDIGAITPDEIAFSILAELIAARRRGQRIANSGATKPQQTPPRHHSSGSVVNSSG
jgi:xanthine dehydrogenase accessory factor